MELEPAIRAARWIHSSVGENDLRRQTRARCGAAEMTGCGLGEPLFQEFAARGAAVPFKSVEAEAAVGEVL